jgi:hypothetical protein
MYQRFKAWLADMWQRLKALGGGGPPPTLPK